ncbi:MAG: DUF362 domain-containing protein [Lentisphaeria bacterium]|nr:DUF362 domain-containing protein [Lentisphaeria bacterium]
MIQTAYARSSDYGKDLRPALEKIFAPQLAAYGDLHGKSILLKPNLLSYKGGKDIISVHPAFLLETAKMFLDHGAKKVTVMENPAVQSAPAILRAMGILEELEKMGVSCANFADYQPVTPPEGSRFRSLELAAEYRRFDAVADLAKAKTHAMMTLTLCVKNLFGLVSGKSRLGWHLAAGQDFERFADLLLDIYQTVKPQFNFLDAVTGMEGNGPGSGTPVELGFVAGSSDALALDAAVAPRLGVPDLLTVRRGKMRGLLQDFQETGEVPELHAITLPDPPGIISSWGLPLPPGMRQAMKQLLLSRPVLDPEKCISCGLCARMCPPQSLKLHEKYPVFDLSNCIRCYCCQEHCPKGAITPVQPWTMKAAGKMDAILHRIFRKK